jgi:hypothetical protein
MIRDLIRNMPWVDDSRKREFTGEQLAKAGFEIIEESINGKTQVYLRCACGQVHCIEGGKNANSRVERINRYLD